MNLNCLFNRRENHTNTKAMQQNAHTHLTNSRRMRFVAVPCTCARCLRCASALWCTVRSTELIHGNRFMYVDTRRPRFPAYTLTRWIDVVETHFTIFFFWNKKLTICWDFCFPYFSLVWHSTYARCSSIALASMEQRPDRFLFFSFLSSVLLFFFHRL